MKGKEGKLPMGEKRNSFIIIFFVSYFLDKKSVVKSSMGVKIKRNMSKLMLDSSY